MNNVTPLNKNSANNLVGDFQKQNIKFDIDRFERRDRRHNVTGL